MGFGFGRLGHKFANSVGSIGKKISHGASRLGHKVHQVSGEVHNIASKVADVSGKVAKVAGVVSKVATAALPFTAEIPIVGEVVGGVAAGSKAVQGVATGVNKVAGMVDRGAVMANRLTR